MLQAVCFVHEGTGADAWREKEIEYGRAAMGMMCQVYGAKQGGY